MEKGVYFCSMKRLLTIVLTLLSLNALSQPASDSSWRADVKTVLLYRDGESREMQSELLTPVLTLGDRGRLTLEFDVLGTVPEQLRWSMAHCDREWRRDDLEPQEFMNGFEYGMVENYEFSFTTLTDYVHYSAVVPDRFAEFTHSGNYVLTVSTVEGDVLLTRRFCVSEQGAVGVGMSRTKPYDGVDVERRQEVDVTLKGSAGGATGVFLRPEYISVLMQQNGRLDNRRWLEFSGYDGDRLAYRNRQPNIFPGGNIFRYFDCSNLHSPMYNVVSVTEYGGEQLVMLKPCEDRSRKHYITDKSLNGGLRVNIWDRNDPRLEADYVWVYFSLPMAQPLLDGNVYVTGR